jgi:DUF2905 family protein
VKRFVEHFEAGQAQGRAFWMWRVRAMGKTLTRHRPQVQERPQSHAAPKLTSVMANYRLAAKYDEDKTGLFSGSIAMARFLIVLGLAILVIGVLWPYLSRIGLGHLPGDIVVKRDNVTFYFPLMTCLLLSLLFSLVLWVVNR